MTIAQVKKATATSAATTSLTATFAAGGTATAGNRLIAIFGSRNNIATVSTPAGWSLVTNQNDGIPDGSVSIFEKLAAGGETGVTVTQTNNTVCELVVFEYSGLVGSTLAGDQNAKNSTAASVNALATGTTGATVVADELVLAVARSNNSVGNGGAFVSATNGFADEGALALNFYPVSKIVNATGTQTTTITWTTSQTAAAAAIATFKGAPAPPVSPPRGMRMSIKRAALR